jgi:hypothetical protein
MGSGVQGRGGGFKHVESICIMSLSISSSRNIEERSEEWRKERERENKTLIRTERTWRRGGGRVTALHSSIESSSTKSSNESNQHSVFGLG